MATEQLLREENLPRHFEQKEKAPLKGSHQRARKSRKKLREGELGKDPQLDRALELLKLERLRGRPERLVNTWIG